MYFDFEIFDFEPYVILEGGMGLADTEKNLSRHLFDKNVTHWVLDELYEKPIRIMSLMALQPKTIVLGTTGTYKDKIETILDLFERGNFYPENVIFTMGEELRVFKEIIEKAKIKVPTIKFFVIMPILNEDMPILLEELKL